MAKDGKRFFSPILVIDLFAILKRKCDTLDSYIWPINEWSLSYVYDRYLNAGITFSNRNLTNINLIRVLLFIKDFYFAVAKRTSNILYSYLNECDMNLLLLASCILSTEMALPIIPWTWPVSNAIPRVSRTGRQSPVPSSASHNRCLHGTQSPWPGEPLHSARRNPPRSSPSPRMQSTSQKAKQNDSGDDGGWCCGLVRAKIHLFMLKSAN